jgi:uncharacterized protein YlaI
VIITERLCEICGEMEAIQKHHLKTKKHSNKTIPICNECHKLIHKAFTNKQLRTEFDTTERILEYKRRFGLVPRKVRRKYKERKELIKIHYQIQGAIKWRAKE